LFTGPNVVDPLQLFGGDNNNNLVVFVTNLRVIKERVQTAHVTIILYVYDPHSCLMIQIPPLARALKAKSLEKI
jgi:hypothetical protein